jgi:hypothetical protein
LRDQAAPAAGKKALAEALRLGRNFLHAARLELTHPLTGKPLLLEAPLPKELENFLERLEAKMPQNASMT